MGVWQANEVKRTPPAILAWKKEFSLFNSRDLVVTCHRFTDDSEVWKLSIFIRDQEEFRHERTYYCYWGARFIEPTRFTYRQDGLDLDVLVLTLNCMAVSSVNIEENAFYVDSFGHLQNLPIEDPKDGTERLLPKKMNEEFSRCDWYFLSEGILQFEYVARVTCSNRAREGYYSVLGRYNLVHQGSGLRFVVAEAHRECTGEGSYVAQLFELANYR